MVTLTLLDPQKKTPLKQWHFENKSVIRIGRSADNDVILTDVLVSRHHLELRQIHSRQDGNCWQIISKGTNGTFLNGVLVVQSLLPDNSLLQLARGGPILKFQTEPVTSPHKPTVSSPNSCTHEGNSPENLFCIHCGQPISVLQTIRDYQILRILGQGGMGTTYLACRRTGEIAGHPQLLVLKQF